MMTVMKTTLRTVTIMAKDDDDIIEIYDDDSYDDREDGSEDSSEDGNEEEEDDDNNEDYNGDDDNHVGKIWRASRKLQRNKNTTIKFSDY